MAELHDLTALEQGAAIRSGEVSPVDLVEHYLDRARRWNDDVGAYVRLTPDLARRQARAAQDAVRRGDLDGRGPLFGVCCPVKDLAAVEGVPMRYGSAVLDVVPDADDDVVTALRAGGLVITGKTNTPEFGLPCYTEPDVAPPARTPWDLTRSASGSSGGAAAAVAAGLAPLAHGSDGGGSVRTPAGVCGLVGLKPSRGRISNGPSGDLPGDLVVPGVLARTVEDAAALLDVLAVPFPADSCRPAGPGPGGFLAAARRTPGLLRVGVFTDPVLADTPVAPEVRAAVGDLADLLADLGHSVQPVPVPLSRAAVADFEVLWSVLALTAEVPAADEPRLRPLTRWLRERGRAVSGRDLAAALVSARGHARRALLATADLDVLVCPTVSQLPAPVGSIRDDADPAADFEAQKRFAAYTALANVTGQPAVNIPACWTADGLPVGVQLLGRPGGEADLVALAARVEQARPWWHRRPPIW